MHTSGETTIGAEISRKYYIYTRWRKVWLSSNGTAALEQELKENLTADYGVKNLKRDEKSSLLWNQVILGLINVGISLSLLTTDDKSVTLLAIAMQGVMLFFFIGNYWIYHLDTIVD